VKIIKEEIIDECWEYEIKALDKLDYVITDECIHSETLITTIEGDVEIQNLKTSDVILTINEKTNVYEYKPIQKIHRNLMISSNEKMYELEIENGIVIKITGNHRVLTDGGWIKVDKLAIGDDIINSIFIK